MPRDSEPTTTPTPDLSSADEAEATDEVDDVVPLWPEGGPDSADEIDADDDLDADDLDAEGPVPPPDPEPEPEAIPLPGPDPVPDPIPLPAADPPPEPEPDPPPEAEPAPVQGEPEDQVVPASGPLLADAGRWEQRWDDVQASFVDDPGTSIHQADQLVTQAMEDLAKALIARRDTLQARWRTTDPAPDTEQLRRTIQGYRALLFGLLSA